MAIYRKPTFKKNYKKKSTWYNKRYSTLDIAKKAWAATKYLKGLVNSERHHTDTTLTLGSNQSFLFYLTGIAQGDTNSNRTGNSVLLKSIYLRGTMVINNAVSANTRVTLLLIKDKQQVSDTSPAITDMLVSSTDPNTLNALGTLGRFQTLWRKSYTLYPVSGGRPAITIDKYFKLQDHVRFNGTASTDIQKNGYYLVAITSEPTNYPSIVINSRISFHDN